VTQPPPVLNPTPPERGLATSDRAALTASVSQSWGLFATMLDDLDLHGPSRARGLTVREVVIPLGGWDDNRPVTQLLREARTGVIGHYDQGALVQRVRAAHRHESDSAIRDSIRRQGRQVTAWLELEERSLSQAPVASMLGTLPLTTFFLASTYPLATAALDLEVGGARIPQALLDNGLLGLVDTIGALAARQGITASISALTPTTLIGMGARESAWRTVRFDVAAQSEAEARNPEDIGPALEGTTRLLLDIAAGRADVPGALRRRELAIRDIAGLLALAPIVEQVPGIPGRSALIAAIRATTTATALLRLLPFRRSEP